MACVCGADSRTAVSGWVFPEAWLSLAFLMTSRPRADELKLAGKDGSGTESPDMLCSSTSRSETHPISVQFSNNFWSVCPSSTPRTSVVSCQKAGLKSGNSGLVPALSLDIPSPPRTLAEASR